MILRPWKRVRELTDLTNDLDESNEYLEETIAARERVGRRMEVEITRLGDEVKRLEDELRRTVDVLNRCRAWERGYRTHEEENKRLEDEIKVLEAHLKSDSTALMAAETEVQLLQVFIGTTADLLQEEAHD